MLASKSLMQRLDWRQRVSGSVPVSSTKIQKLHYVYTLNHMDTLLEGTHMTCVLANFLARQSVGLSKRPKGLHP